VHLGAELPPGELTFQEVDGGRFLARVDVFGDVVDENGVVVAKVDEAATVSLARQEVERRRANAFGFEAVRRLVPGRYRVTLLLQDYGQGKLGRAEGEVRVPPPPVRDALRPLVLSFRVDRSEPDAPGRPFTVAGFKLQPRPFDRYRQGEPVYVFALLHQATAGLAERDLEVTLEVRRGDAVAFRASARSPAAGSARERAILLTLPTERLASGRYRLEVAVRDEGREVAAAETDLELVDSAQPPGLFLYSEKREVPAEVDHYHRGIQLLSRGDLGGAERHFRIALAHRPGFRPATVYLARTLLLGGHAGEAEPLLAQVLRADPDDYDALVTVGSLHLQRGEFAEASRTLARALEVGARTKELLNGLGEASLGLKDAEAARRYFAASLEIDPQQDLVRRRLQALGGS
jgi:tetratricopeptide (TPR) repeat protein